MFQAPSLMLCLANREIDPIKINFAGAQQTRSPMMLAVLLWHRSSALHQIRLTIISLFPCTNCWKVRQNFQFESTNLLCDRACKSTSLVAKKFTFQQASGNRSAV